MYQKVDVNPIETRNVSHSIDSPGLARIGVMRALNRHVERVFDPERKNHHWGKRKLKRDQ